MITTVTLNPAVDRTLTVETLHIGEVNRVLSVHEEMGGKGINVSKVLHALSVETTAIGLIGKRNIDQTNALLRDTQISHAFLEIDALTRTNIKIVDAVKKQTTDLNESGFNVKVSDLQKFDEKLKTWAMRSDFVVLSGSLPTGLAPDTYRRIIQQHAQLSEFVLDADGEALVEGVKAHPFLIKPNLDELNTAFRKNLKTQEEIIAFCKILLETYDLGLILLSLGAQGSLLVADDAVYIASSLKVDVNSTVGAGDAMLAGFLAGLSRSLALQECLRIANVCGALMCARQTDKRFDYEDVISRLNEIDIQIL